VWRQRNDFEGFTSLEVLWINDNRLAKLDGLDANFRVKSIYAANNRISTLKVAGGAGDEGNRARAHAGKGMGRHPSSTEATSLLLR
jgi:hypothetical protein